MDALQGTIGRLNDLIWNTPEGLSFLVVLLLFTGLFLTVRLGFIQLRRMGHSIRAIAGRYSDPHDAGDPTLDRYIRQVRYPGLGADGQRRLLDSRALVCGCGALGSVLANTLARSGVGHLRIVDRDFLELNNLQRQVLYDEEDVAAGLPKAVAAQAKLRKINSQIDIEAIVADVDHTTIGRWLEGVDVIVDGTDNFETRFLLNDAAVRFGIPWVYGGCVGAEGQTMTILPGETPCLRCLLQVAAAPVGEPVVTLTGPRQSGKTTLVNLLPRFYDYTHGQVLLDGVELNRYPRRYLRQQIGIVEQEPFLFSRSIRENITYGVGRDISQEEIEKAARAAAIHDVIITFTEGYDTLVGEKGVTLSGGQKQRLALSTALLTDPEVLLLDDTTSALDAETECRTTVTGRGEELEPVAPGGLVSAGLRYSMGLQATPVRPPERDAWEQRIFCISQGTEGFTPRLRVSAALLDRLVAAGVRAVVLFEHWADAEGYVRTPHTRAVRRIVDACHARGLQVLLYFGFLISDLADEWPAIGKDCLVLPKGGYPVFHYQPQPEQSAWRVCLNSLYQDLLVDGIARALDQFDADGVYLDGTEYPFACANSEHGCGHHRPEGDLAASYPLFAVRSAMRRIHAVVRARRCQGLVNVHNSTCMTIPTLGWATSSWDGEQFGSIPRGVDVMTDEATR